MLAYRIDLAPDDNGTVMVTSPDLPGMVTFGDTEAEARLHAVDAIETMLESMLRNEEDVPAPRGTDSGACLVKMSTLTSLKVALDAQLKSHGIGREELADRLRWARGDVDELFVIDEGTRLDRLEAAFGALGDELVFLVGRAA